MTKRSILVLALALVIVVGAAAWQVHSSREPVYEGRRLSVWLEEFNKTGGTRDSNRKAREAIRQIGTNAIPILLATLRCEDSRFKLTLVAWTRKLPLFRSSFTSAQQRRIRAFLALDALGSAATPAVPELISLLKATDYQIRDLSAQALGSIRVPEHLVVPALTNALNDSNLRVRMSIEESLGRIRKAPEMSVPALAAMLGSADVAERQRVLVALSHFGSDSRSAWPAGGGRLQDPDRGMRDASTNVLKLIDRPRPARMAATRRDPPAEAQKPSPGFKAHITCFNGKLDSRSSCSGNNWQASGGIMSRDGDMTCGYADKVSKIEWEFVETRDGKDIYRFTRRFPFDTAASTVTNTIVKYDATSRIVIFQDQFQAIVIDPPKP